MRPHMKAGAGRPREPKRDSAVILNRHLVEQWRTLFDAKFDVLLYDLTSTYFEGMCEGIPKARHGYSRDAPPVL